jgi:hypothetical protein
MTAEEKAYHWFKENHDENSIWYGGSNSKVIDIWSEKYGWVEAKDITNGARCGQFTESTLKNNPYSNNIYLQKYTNDDIINFIKYHYKKKEVNYFIVSYYDKFYFHGFEDFFNSYDFDLQQPYEKRSGTRSAPIKDREDLLKLNSNFFLGSNNKVYCNDKNLFGEYISLNSFLDYFISKKDGELRKRSNTKNLTWHMLIIKNKIDL